MFFKLRMNIGKRSDGIVMSWSPGIELLALIPRLPVDVVRSPLM
jgi:hypothetical protein